MEQFSVRIDPLFQAKDPSRTSGSYVTFEPGARSAWHRHPLGQTLIVTAGSETATWKSRQSGSAAWDFRLRPGHGQADPPAASGGWKATQEVISLIRSAVERRVFAGSYNYLPVSSYHPVFRGLLNHTKTMRT